MDRLAADRRQHPSVARARAGPRAPPTLSRTRPGHPGRRERRAPPSRHLGGNVVRSAPASDLVPVLLALDAEVDLVGPRGDRRLPVDRFVRSSRKVDLGPGELVRSIRFPEGRPSAYLWQRVRPANDISQVAVALAFSPGERTWRVAVGGVFPRPVRLPEPARVLGVGAPSAGAVAHAARLVGEQSPFVTDRRASEEYRRRVVSALFVRGVASVVQGRGSPDDPAPDPSYGQRPRLRTRRRPRRRTAARHAPLATRDERNQGGVPERGLRVVHGAGGRREHPLLSEPHQGGRRSVGHDHRGRSGTSRSSPGSARRSSRRERCSAGTARRGS